MQIGKLSADNMLGIKVEQEPTTRYSTRGSLSQDQIVYKVSNAGPEAKFKVGTKVLLKPNEGNALYFQSQSYAVFTNDNVLCTIED